MYDETFNLVKPNSFKDANIPKSFAPFGIRNFNGMIYVTYAKQGPGKHDDEAGPGNGFINVFDTNGNLLRRLVSNGALNSPWGLALIEGDELWVGNFGDGKINNYDPTTGASLGTINRADGTPLQFDGLWDMLPLGAGVFFTAGIADEGSVDLPFPHHLGTAHVAHGFHDERVPHAGFQADRIADTAADEELGHFSLLRGVFFQFINVIAHPAVTFIDDRDTVKANLGTTDVAVVGAGVFAVVEFNVDHRGALKADLGLNDAIGGGDFQAMHSGMGCDGGFAIGGGNGLVAGLRSFEYAALESECRYDSVPNIGSLSAFKIVRKK
jgi:hypothetical protein